ncbi:MAG: hypothetical protein F4X65_07820 [Chloroflexi bacterium]|nr:hypothetical protein [Chloroflexota bacterium]
MTTKNRRTISSTPEGETYRFPDIPEPPERNPEDMTSFRHLAKTGILASLTAHFGNRDGLLVEGERFMAALPHRPASERRFPDLLIAFNANPELYDSNNGYLVSGQGKPPDFVLEIASPSTRRNDNGEKRSFYANLGVLEYWRFDEEDTTNSVKLLGERLVNGEYIALEITQLEEGLLESYSPVLGLSLRWERGELRWYDHEAGQYIFTLAEELERRRVAEVRAEQEREQRRAAEGRAEQERQQREAAEARLQELESQIRQLRGEG